MSTRTTLRDPFKQTTLPRRDEAARRTARLFAPAIFTGALLLFAVQPLIARYVLPWFGGGPGIWTTCMLFFQALLLGGYLYAHLSVRLLSTRGQIILHAVLLIGALAMIPIIPNPRWKPAGADDPVGHILLLLAATIGLPYFVLSATSPLLQAWFVRARPGASPYRLFALSNLGSLLALIGYPIVLEPLFGRAQQAWVWSIGLVAFAVMCLICVRHVWKQAGVGTDTANQTNEPPAETEQGSRFRVALWLALPLVASVLLLAVTNTLTQDVAATPMLWIVPLAIYLLTFVIAFDASWWYARRTVLVLLPLLTIWILRLQWYAGKLTFLEQFIGYLTALFVLCMFCHGELARLKPHPRHLTGYYLAISIGGALGGVFVAVVAPIIFNRLFELSIGMLAAGLLGLFCVRRDTWLGGKAWAGAFTAAAAVLVALPTIKSAAGTGAERVIERSRNFYGTLLVTEITSPPEVVPRQAARVLGHGTTTHGQQIVELPNEPTLYYSRASAIGFAMQAFPRQENRRIGLVGLGVGTLAAYGKTGDTFRFYEIDPDVERLARKYFTFLQNSPATVEVVTGDARLMLEREQSQQFDVLVLDAFSGDSIPTHLLTSEAFDLYVRHLKPDGLLAIHYSNRAADLTWVLVQQARRLGFSVSAGNPQAGTWMLMSHDTAFLNSPAMLRGTRTGALIDRGELWTDDHIKLIRVIRWLSH